MLSSRNKEEKDCSGFDMGSCLDCCLWSKVKNIDLGSDFCIGEVYSGTLQRLEPGLSKADEGLSLLEDGFDF